MDPLRILFSLHYELDPNEGAAGATLALGESLQDLGQEVEYLSLDDMPVRLPKRAAFLTYPPFAALRIARRARKGLDVIDGKLGDTWVWADFVHRFWRGPNRPLLVSRSHGLEHLFHEATAEQAAREGRKFTLRYYLYWKWWRLREVQRSMLAADLVLMLNERECEYAVERLGVSEDRVRLVANGVPTWLLDAGRREPTPASSLSIALVGRYRLMKGVTYGTAALIEVMRKFPAARASFIGAGVPAAEVLEPFPTDLRERVSVVENYRREELPELLKDQAILLFPSLSEGFSLALLESMACGLAPVASNLSSVQEVIEDGENGLIVPAGDAEALTSALLRVVSDDDLRRRFQVAARATAEQFSWERIGKQTLDLYREGIESRDRRPTGPPDPVAASP